MELVWRGDLLVHLLSGMQFVLGINEAPKRASAFGGIYRWKDGRNTPDVHPVLFEYANVPVYMRLTLGTETAEVTRFLGSKGIIELTEFGLTHIPQPGVDMAPSYYCYGLPSRLRNAYFKQWHEEHDPKPGQEPAPQTVSYKGNDYDDLRPHLWNFSRPSGRGSPSCKTLSSVITPRSAVTWQTNLTIARAPYIGMTFRRRLSPKAV